MNRFKKTAVILLTLFAVAGMFAMAGDSCDKTCAKGAKATKACCADKAATAAKTDKMACCDKASAKATQKCADKEGHCAKGASMKSSCCKGEKTAKSACCASKCSKIADKSDEVKPKDKAAGEKTETKG